MYQSESLLCGHNIKFPSPSAGNLFENKKSMTPQYLLLPFHHAIWINPKCHIYTKEAKSSQAASVTNQWRTKAPEENL